MKGLYKILLLGNRGVGKTTYIQQYLGRPIDTGVRNIYGTNFLLKHGGIYMMIWDDPMQYQYIGTDGAIIMGDDPMYWYSRVYEICGDVPTVSIPDKSEVCTYDPFITLLDNML